MSQIICKNLALGYDGRLIAEELDFSVEKGDYLCIVGENGVGKSTLLKALLGLIQPLHGEIITDKELKSGGTGYLPQQTEVQKDFPASVEEIVRSGFLKSCGIKPFYSKTQKLLAAEKMRRLGIEDLKKRSYRELSGGQQQRVLLARALCASEKILFLDEPASGLDPVATSEMYSVIAGLNRDMGITVVMVSHDIRAAVKYSKHILHLGNKPLFFGETEEYIKSGIGRTFLNTDNEGGTEND